MLQALPALSAACVALCDMCDKLGSQVGVEPEPGARSQPLETEPLQCCAGRLAAAIFSKSWFRECDAQSFQVFKEGKLSFGWSKPCTFSSVICDEKMSDLKQAKQLECIA